MLGRFWKWLLGADAEAGDLMTQMAMPRWWRGFWYLVIALLVIGTVYGLASCAPRDADAALPPDAPALAVTADSTSVHLVIRFHAPVSATSVLDTAGVIGVSGSKPGHTLPATATGDTFAFPLPSGDSLPLFACLRSVRALPTDAPLVSERACASVTWHRPVVAPEPPAPPVIDSIRVIGMHLMPDSVTLAAGQTQQFCVLWHLASGHWAVRSRDRASGCDGYLAAPAFQAGGLATAPEQAMVDTLCVTWRASGGTITGEDCSGLGLNSSLRRRQLAAVVFGSVKI